MTTNTWLALGLGWTAAAVSGAAAAYVVGGVGMFSALMAGLSGFAVTLGVLRLKP